MSCRPVRSPPPPSPLGVRRSWRRGRTRPGAAAVTLCGVAACRGWGLRAGARRGAFWAAAAVARGRRGESERSGGLGPNPRRGGGGSRAQAAFPDLTWTGRWGEECGVPGDMPAGPREVGVRSSPSSGVGIHGGASRGATGAPGRAVRAGPCGKEEWPPDCAAGHPPGLVELGWEGWIGGGGASSDFTGQTASQKITVLFLGSKLFLMYCILGPLR